MLLEASNTKYRFRIKEDFPEVGAYLYVYDSDGKCIYDYLQDDVEVCKEFALEEFGVPLSAWIDVADASDPMGG